ncbi:MAG TPA: alkaline phosphatase family protein [Gemmatimonadaceae bacterium]|nr:alkaline phosphatase family protein [Gemmatimonadaceae bacterium]
MPDLTIAHSVQRLVVVVLDGLRPDAIEALRLSNVARLAAGGASTLRGTTVAPSVTAACMASLLTGVAPDTHGVRSTRFHLPRSRGRMHPLPRVLGEAGYPSSAFMCRVPWLMRGIARRIAGWLGVGSATFHGTCARDVLACATDALAAQDRGLILMHWPDCDDAGHDHGWMSDPYQRAAYALDASLGQLVERIDLRPSSKTLLIAIADHGGGGQVPTDHDSPHPLDRTIPIVLAGGGVSGGSLREGAQLLDVPPTVLSALGVAVPTSYEGRSLVDAGERAALAG